MIEERREDKKRKRKRAAKKILLRVVRALHYTHVLVQLKRNNDVMMICDDCTNNIRVENNKKLGTTRL